MLSLYGGQLVGLFSRRGPGTQSENEQEWGEANLHDYLNKAKGGPARSIIEQIIREIDRFADGASQHDDITLLILKAADESTGNPAVSLPPQSNNSFNPTAQ